MTNWCLLLLEVHSDAGRGWRTVSDPWALLSL